MCIFDVCAGLGGALSVYFGLSAALQLLDVAFFSFLLHQNVFTNCTVNASEVFGGNVNGGGVSVYMGAYFLAFNFSGFAKAAVSDTFVRNLSVNVETVVFTSCSAITNAQIGNSYGGSFSLYVGAYTWSTSFGRSSSSSSSSTSGSITVTAVNVSISNANSSDSKAVAMGQNGANSYGGAMSVFYIGAYVWSEAGAPSAFSSSVSSTIKVADLVVSIRNSTFTNSSAVSRTFFPLIFIVLN